MARPWTEGELVTHRRTGLLAAVSLAAVLLILLQVFWVVTLQGDRQRDRCLEAASVASNQVELTMRSEAWRNRVVCHWSDPSNPADATEVEVANLSLR